MNTQASSSSAKGKTSSDRKNFKVTKKGNRSFYQNPNLEPSDWDLDSDEVYESEVTIMPAKKDSGPVPSSSSGRNPNNDGILDLSSRANTSGTPKRTRSRSDPGAQTGKRPNKPTPKPGSGKPKTSSTKPKRGPLVPRPLGRGKARKEPKVPMPQCPVLDAVNEAPIDWELLDFLLEEDEAHYKCWTVNEAGEALAKCIAKEGTSSVCQSKDRERTLDGMLQLMTNHDELRDNEYFYTAVTLLQVNCLLISVNLKLEI